MQCAVIEYARNAAGLKGANSTEFDENTAVPVIDLMTEQKNVKGYGGTMRLGAYDCNLKKVQEHRKYTVQTRFLNVIDIDTKLILTT